MEREQALARLAENEAALEAAREAAHHQHAAHSESAEAELTALRADLETARLEADGLRAESEAGHAQAELLRGQLETARAELAAIQAELQEARGESSLTRGEAAALRAALHSADGALEHTRGELQARAAELAETQEQLARTRSELDAARAAAEAIRAEFSLGASDGHGQGADRATTTADGHAPASPLRAVAPEPAQPAAPRLELPAVGVGQAAALIGLDGTFKRLDDAFCRLLGCREEDLHAARWPSIIDRDNHDEHQEIARRLKAGQQHSAEIETVYMHAQGLLVPIAGTVTMHRADPGGPPTHYLFRADVSRTAGG